MVWLITAHNTRAANARDTRHWTLLLSLSSPICFRKEMVKVKASTYPVVLMNSLATSVLMNCLATSVLMNSYVTCILVNSFATCVLMNSFVTCLTNMAWFSGWGDSCGSARHGHPTMP